MTTLKRFTELTTIIAANVDDADIIPIVDVSEGETEAASRKITVAELKSLFEQYFKGYFADYAALIAAYPTGQNGWFAILGSTDTVWAWDAGTAAWIDTDTKGEVTSVFARTGPVTAAASDYDASQIDNDSDAPGTFVDDALTNLFTKVVAVDLDVTTSIVLTYENRVDLTTLTVGTVTAISNGQYNGQLLLIRVESAAARINFQAALANVTIQGDWYVINTNAHLMLRWDTADNRWKEVGRFNGASGTASGLHAVSFGTGNTNTGKYTLMHGESNSNTADYSAVFGEGNANTGAHNSLVFGNSVTNAAGGGGSLVGGLGCINAGPLSIVTGDNNANNNQHSLVMGHDNINDADFSMILGDTCTNNAGATHSFILGLNNVNNTAGALIVGGYCTNTGYTSFLFGLLNTSSADYNCIFGSKCLGDQPYVTVHGDGAYGRIKAMIAFSSLSATTLAVSQGGMVQQQGNTVDAATVFMVPAITTPTDYTIAVIGLMTARQTAGAAGTVGDSGAWKFEALIKNVGGIPTLIVNTVTLIGRDINFAVLAKPVLILNGTNLGVRVTGQLNKVIRWGCVITLSEINSLT